MDNAKKGIAILLSVGSIFAYNSTAVAAEATQPPVAATPGSTSSAPDTKLTPAEEAARQAAILAARKAAREKILQSVKLNIAYLNSLQTALKSSASGTIKIGGTEGVPTESIIDASNPAVNANLAKSSEKLSKSLSNLSTILANDAVDPPSDQDVQSILSFKQTLDNTPSAAALFGSLLRMNTEVTKNVTNLTQQLQQKPAKP